MRLLLACFTLHYLPRSVLNESVPLLDVLGTSCIHCTAIEDEPINGGERVQLCLLYGVGTGHVGDARSTHRTPPKTSSARLSFLGRWPTPMLLSKAMSNSE